MLHRRGHWSSFPPHKHDRDDGPDEVSLEELYFFKIDPSHGFGLQWIYGRAGDARADVDTAFAVRENDLAIIPYGYHPVAAPPGYQVYYLWFLAGRTRHLRPKDDPAHAWIRARS